MNNIFQKKPITISILMLATIVCLGLNIFFSEDLISTSLLGLCLLLLLSQLKKENIKL